MITIFASPVRVALPPFLVRSAELGRSNVGLSSGRSIDENDRLLPESRFHSQRAAGRQSFPRPPSRAYPDVRRRRLWDRPFSGAFRLVRLWIFTLCFLKTQLLEKPPQVMEGGDRPERDGTLDCESLEISMETVDLDMTDAAQAAQIRTELLRLQQLRDRQHPSDSHQQSVRPKVPSRRSGPTHNSDASGAREQGATSQPTGVLGSEQLAEISRLLSQYGEDAEAGNAVTSLTSDPASVTQLLTLLAMLPQQQAHSGTEERRSASTKNSPRGNGSRKARDPHRSKRTADVRHHSAGPDTSLSSVMSDRHDRTMASSTKSTTSRKSDKKSSATASANTSSSSAKQSVRPISKDKQPQAWK